MVHFMRVALLILAMLALLALPVASAADAPLSASLPTYYELLESEPTATDKELKKAYRRLALLTHPDKATSDSDRSAREAQFIQLSNAYEILSNADLRPRYDYLLTQHVHVYDDRARDWSTFDPATGAFSRPSKQTVTFGNGRFSFSSSYADARQTYEAEQAEEAREKRALLLALLGSLAVAVTPVAYFYAQRFQQSRADKKRKLEANESLRVKQQALAELQEERAEEERQRKEDERKRAAEVRRQRESAALAAEEEDEVELEANNTSEEGVETSAATEGSNGRADEVAAESEEEDRPKRSGGAAAFSCELCRKKFKSEQQSARHHSDTRTRCTSQPLRPLSLTAVLCVHVAVCRYDNHIASNQHKKAMKQAERGK